MFIIVLVKYASTYKRKTQQQTWDSESMEKAIRAVRNEEMGYLKASKEFEVPRSTLKRRVKGINKEAVENKKLLGSCRPTFSLEREQELVNHILEMKKRFTD